MNFIPAQYYSTIYLVFVALLTIIELNTYSHRRGNEMLNRSGNIIYIVVSMVILFVGLRPVNEAFGDTVMYDLAYSDRFGAPFVPVLPGEGDFLFDNILVLFASLKLPVSVFFLTIALGYFGLMCWACRRLFPNDAYISFLVFLAAFSTFSYSTNGLRAGLAASVFILGLSYRNNLKACIPIVLLSWGFHHSMHVPILAFLISCVLNKKINWFFYLWIFSFFIAALHITFFQNFFAGLTDESGAEYLMAGADSFITGFRPDFIIYSAFPIYIGWKYLKQRHTTSKLYNSLLITYTLTNSVWMLNMYALYTNRIVYLSWLLYPVVLIYPFLNEEYDGNRYSAFSNVASIHLAFTLFMSFVYYGLLK